MTKFNMMDQMYLIKQQLDNQKFTHELMYYTVKKTVYM